VGCDEEDLVGEDEGVSDGCEDGTQDGVSVGCLQVGITVG
jgi:hypothetical protein